jgi:general secretion pathway protein C
MILRMATVTPPVAERNIVGTLLVAALVIALAWQLAYWTWVFATPAPLASVPATREAPPDIAVASRLFGGSATASTASASTSGLRLKGVVAPTPGVAASAIFSTGSGKDASIFIGNEVQPGVKLTEVHPDHVIVARAGVSERIDLEARKSAGGPSSTQPARTVGFKINVSRTGANSFSFSRKELDDALRDPYQLNYLGQIGMPPGGGVRMEQAPPGSLAQKLGLQPGDIIKKVNGQTVASTGDLARLYTQFNTLSSIQAEVQRGGATVHLSYAIQ